MTLGVVYSDITKESYTVFFFLSNRTTKKKIVFLFETASIAVNG